MSIMIEEEMSNEEEMSKLMSLMIEEEMSKLMSLMIQEEMSNEPHDRGRNVK